MKISALSRICCAGIFCSGMFCFAIVFFGLGSSALAEPGLSAVNGVDSRSPVDKARLSTENSRQGISPSEAPSIGSRARLADSSDLDKSPSSKESRARERARREAVRDVALMMIGISRRSGGNR